MAAIAGFPEDPAVSTFIGKVLGDRLGKTERLSEQYPWSLLPCAGVSYGKNDIIHKTKVWPDQIHGMKKLLNLLIQRSLMISVLVLAFCKWYDSGKVEAPLRRRCSPL